MEHCDTITLQVYRFTYQTTKLCEKVKVANEKGGSEVKQLDVEGLPELLNFRLFLTPMGLTFDHRSTFGILEDSFKIEAKSNNFNMQRTPKEFEPRRKPSMLVECLAYIFLYGPIFTFFYCIIQGLKWIFGY